MTRTTADLLKKVSGVQLVYTFVYSVFLALPGNSDKQPDLERLS